MAKWNSASPVSTGGIERLNISKDIQNGQSIDIRLVGDYLARYIYWVTLSDGGKRTIECLSFDRKSEALDYDRKDPMVGKKTERGEEIKPQFAYVVNVIDRSDGKLKLMELKKTIFNEIVGLAQNPKYGDPADPETGYDLTISKEKTGPLAMNVKYNVLPDRQNSPLTAEEKAIKLYDLEKLHPEPSYEDQCDWLRENTDILEGEDMARVGNDATPHDGADVDVDGDDIPL